MSKLGETEQVIKYQYQVNSKDHINEEKTGNKLT